LLIIEGCKDNILSSMLPKSAFVNNGGFQQRVGVSVRVIAFGRFRQILVFINAPACSEKDIEQPPLSASQKCACLVCMFNSQPSLTTASPPTARTVTILIQPPAHSTFTVGVTYCEVYTFVCFHSEVSTAADILRVWAVKEINNNNNPVCDRLYALLWKNNVVIEQESLNVLHCHKWRTKLRPQVRRIKAKYLIAPVKPASIMSPQCSTENRQKFIDYGLR